MGIEGYFTLLIIVAMIAILVREKYPSAIVLSGALVLFLFTGIVTPEQMLAGFSNQGMMIIALLFIVASGIQHTGIFHRLSIYFLTKRKKSNLSQSLLKMMIPVSTLSAFLNNTPIVIIFAPIVKKWAEWMQKPPSKYLMPLSYAAIFGGICTLIGTSTNLIIHGMMIDRGFNGISMFELTKIGLPCTVIGWIYLAFFGQRLLPAHKGFRETVLEHKKEYGIEMKVTKGCPLIGKTIKDAGLRNLKNVYLIEVERNNQRFGPVSPKESINEADILNFVGLTSGIVELQDIPGLVPAAHKVIEEDLIKYEHNIVEAVVSESSPLLGKTVKESDFRRTYGAGVIAIHRNGQRVQSKIGDIPLRAGDVLLLLARNSFLHNWSESSDFYLISKIKEQNPQSQRKGIIAIAILALMVLVVGFNRFLPTIAGYKISMFYAATAAAALMIITGSTNINQAKHSIKFNVLLTIVAALGISKALANSGAATFLASGLIDLVKGLGPIGVLAGIYIITAIFAATLTNVAAAALVFPIAYSAALQLGVSPRPFFIAIMVAAAASFSTPIGYQTNLIVQGAGGYKFSDYIKVGIPLSILFFIAATAIIPLFWSF